MEPVDVGRLQDRIAVARKVAVTLIVGQENDYIRVLGGFCRRRHNMEM